MDENQIEKKDASKFFRKCILNKDFFKQFQNRDKIRRYERVWRWDDHLRMVVG